MATPLLSSWPIHFPSTTAVPSPTPPRRELAPAFLSREARELSVPPPAKFLLSSPHHSQPGHSNQPAQPARPTAPLVLLKQRSIRSISVEASQCDKTQGASMLFLAANLSSTVFTASSEFQTQRSPKRDFEEGVVGDLK
ncbi:unnamed protein product [Sphagnum jensenii]|uniref:Uncharacterized protein n=1 Tax=Sphagnum jensenii TaxID=128206 RepID=A0ABP1AQE2_9BRYO